MSGRHVGRGLLPVVDAAMRVSPVVPDDGRIAAVEVTAAGTLTRDATRGLEHLRDRLGGRFVAGLVLNMGSQAQQVGDRLAVAPVDELWS